MSARLACPLLAVLGLALLPHLLRRAATAADRIVTAIEEATP